MDALRFWRYKLLQLFHDPPGKPFYFQGKKGGHKKGAETLIRTLLEVPKRTPIFTRPDRALAGADRAVLPGPKQGLRTVGFLKDEDRRITHPLCAGPLLQPVVGPEETQALSREVREDLLDDQQAVATDLQLNAAEWNDAKQLQAAYLRLWRRFRDELIQPDGLKPGEAEPGELLWERMPADTRQPDHSIWDHTRLSAACAFMDTPMPPLKLWGKQLSDPLRYRVPEAQTPWLLTLSLGPVQDFIAESRKSQDLWVSSMLLADLFLHTLAPLIEAYGPDCVLYPDLRGNPHFDRWCKQQKEGQPGANMLNPDADPTTYAGILPNTGVILVPLGAEGLNEDSALKRLEVLAGQCAQRMQDRWSSLADLVKTYLERDVELNQGRASAAKGMGGGRWTEIWEEQCRTPRLGVTWSAVAWQMPEPVAEPPEIHGALPGQDWNQDAVQQVVRKRNPATAAQDEQAEKDRARRLERWVPPRVWDHYALTRAVFSTVNLDYVQQERGFDYALVHHQLFARHALRKLAGRAAPLRDEPGEKCTLCRTRSALYGATKLTAPSSGSARRMAASESQREEVRTFWRALDPDEQGRERLCMVCTLKRFLIPAGGSQKGINPVWAGNEGAVPPREEKARVPFPSTTTLAAERFLLDICDAPVLRPQLQAVVQAYRKTGLPLTSFPRAMPQLAVRAAKDEVVRDFLKIEPQLSIIPETSQRMVHDSESEQANATPQRLRQSDEAKRALQDLSDAVRSLRREAKRVLSQQGKPAEPVSRYALIRLDGDQISQLLLGDPEVLRARWRDVLHPKVVAHIEQSGPDSIASKSGWKSLLDRQRLMGPSLHAFISRVLADFSHRVVPWVVEREFDGRLVYAGGDDVLALAPADQALPLVARLQQLYSAAWLVDTDHRPDAWSWRRQIWGLDEQDGQSSSQAPHQRFVALAGVPSDAAGMQEIIPVPLSPQTRVQRPIRQDTLSSGRSARSDAAEPLETQPLGRSVQGPVLPMMGPHHTLSAAIVYAHFKTPIGDLLKHSKVLLDETAKDGTGRGAVALARYSRNGLKEVCALQWHQRRSPGANALPPAHEVLSRVQEGFRSGALAGRFPYKLREWMRMFEPLVQTLLDQQTADAIQPGEVTKWAQAGQLSFTTLASAAARRVVLHRPRSPLTRLLIGAILQASDAGGPEDNPGVVLPDDLPENAEKELSVQQRDVLYLWQEGIQLHADCLSRSLDGLLLCRALSSTEEEDAA